MSSVMPRIVMAVALVALGWLSWRAGRIEGRMADADRDLATFRYPTPVEAYDQIEGSIGYLDRLLQAALGRSDDPERRRETKEYWLTEYATLLATHDTEGQPPHDDPARLLVSANAVFRATIQDGGEGEVIADRLGDAVSAYADVLRADPTQIDAAYNYEFVARLRDALSAGRQLPHVRLDPIPSATSPGEPPDSASGSPAGPLPAGPTLHGWPGAPPLGMTLDDLLNPFKVHVPLRPTEREESDGAGRGPRRPRKG